LPQKIHNVEPTSEDLSDLTPKVVKKKFEIGEKRESSVLAEITLDGDSDSENSAKDGSIPGSGDAAKKPRESSASSSTPGLSASKDESATQPDGAKPVFNGGEQGGGRFCCNDCWFATDCKEKLAKHFAEKHPAAFEEPEVNRPEPDGANLKPPGGPETAQSVRVSCRMKCSLCPLDTEDMDEMVNHFGTNGHFAPGKTVMCPRCPFIAGNSEDLTLHGESHFEGFSLAQYNCSKCDMVCNTIAKMESHWQVAHFAKN
jgi:hypothetical protein